MQSLNNLVVILMSGAFVLLAFLGISNPMKINRKGNFWFGLLMLMWASFWTEEVAELSGIQKINDGALALLHGVHIFVSLLIYFSFISYVRINHKLSPKMARHFILPFIYMAIQAWIYVRPSGQEFLQSVQTGVLQTMVLLYISLSYLILRKHRKQLLRYASNTQGMDLKWLEYIIILVLVTSIIVVLHNIINKNGEPGIVMNGTNLLAALMVGYQFLRQKEIYPVRPDKMDELNYLEDEPEVTERRKLMADDELEALKGRLIALMQENEVFLDSELNMVRLADHMAVTPHQLSYVINTGYGQNFFQFVNQYRVAKAKQLLAELPGTTTILAIAFDSGFNSKTSFNTTFKKITGQTPSEYRKGYK